MEAQILVLNLLAIGLSQEEIEKETGIPQPTISKVKRGKNADIRLSYFRALESLYAKNKQRAQRIARAQQETKQLQQSAAGA